MLEAEKGTCQLTIKGISRAAAKRIAEEWAGGEMVWVDGVAYPTCEDQPCVIEVMKCQPALTLCPTCNNDFRKCTAMTPNVAIEGLPEGSPARMES